MGGLVYLWKHDSDHKITSNTKIGTINLSTTMCHRAILGTSISSQ